MESIGIVSDFAQEQEQEPKGKNITRKVRMRRASRPPNNRTTAEQSKMAFERL
jgi:hypothetical protein